MRDLLIITPSRSRPQQLGEFLAACSQTCQGSTDVAVGLDDDDPLLAEYKSLPSLVGRYIVGPRDGLTGWTNKLAQQNLDSYSFFASLGDDHRPRTTGWDVTLMEAIQAIGGTGFAYGDDLAMRERLPTAVVVSADIVKELGWFCNPACGHYEVDHTWKDLGQHAGCLQYVPEVIIEHLHCTTGKSAWDQTYADAGSFYEGHPDQVAYRTWYQKDMPEQADRIKDLRLKRIS